MTKKVEKKTKIKIEKADSRLTDFLEKFNNCAAFRRSYEPTWEASYQNYRCYLKVKANEDKGEYANVFIPETFNAVIAELARLVPAVALTRPLVSVVPREIKGRNAATETTKCIEALIDYEWTYEMGVIEQLIYFIQQQILLGTTVGIAYQEKGRPFPTFKTLDLLDVWVPQDATIYIDDLEYIIYRTRITPSALEAKFKKGLYKGDFSKIQAAQVEDPNKARLSSVDLAGGKPGDKIELYHLVTDERILTVANKEVVIRDDKNPFKHGKKFFIAAQKFPDLNHFYGIGAGEPIASLQEEQNCIHNQRLDAVAMLLKFAFIAPKDAAPDLSNFSFRNNSILYVEPGVNMVPIVKPQIPPSAYMDSEKLHQLIQLTSGASDTMEGMNPKGFNDTAFGLNALLQEGAKKFNFSLFSLGMQALRRLAFLTFELNKQFLTLPTVVPIIGRGAVKEFAEITDKEMQFGAQFIPSITSLEDDRPIRISQMMQFLEVLGRLSQASGKPLPTDAIVKRVAELLNIPDFEELTQNPQTSQIDMLKQILPMVGGMQGEGSPMPPGAGGMPAMAPPPGMGG